VASDEARVRQLAHNFDAEVESVTVQAKDGAVLRAWSIVPHPDNGNSVIPGELAKLARPGIQDYPRASAHQSADLAGKFD